MFAHPKIVFLHVPKTAGSSVLDALGKAFGPPLDPLVPLFHAIHRLIPELALDAPRVCVVRNPWSWHASLYQFCKHRGSALSPLLARLSRDFQDSFELTLPRLLDMSRSDLSFCIRMMAQQRRVGPTEMADIGDLAKSVGTVGFYGALHAGISGPGCDALCLSHLDNDLPAWCRQKTGVDCPIPSRLNASLGLPPQWTPALVDLVRAREPLMVERFGYEFGKETARCGAWTSPSSVLDPGTPS